MNKTFHVITRKRFGEKVTKTVCVSIRHAGSVSISVDGERKHFKGESARTNARRWMNDKVQGSACTVNADELYRAGYFDW